MPTRPDIVSLTNTGADVLNAIRNSATTNYRNYIPIATADTDSIKKIGNIIMDYPNLQNEFVQALINRIGRVLITSKMYSNPWSKFKKGIMELGETVEEIFVDIAKPFSFDPAVAESKVFERENPDIKSAFHVMNYQKFYKVTVTRAQLKTAFLSYSQLYDLISKIVDSCYTAAAYDEFTVMKYLLARHILDGHFYAVNTPAATGANAKAIAAKFKSVSNQIEFLSTDYNVAGVHTHTDKPSQNLIISADFDAIMDVEVLASAFNMNKAEFLGQRVLIDSFDDIDSTRLGELFADDPSYTALTEGELTALATVTAVIIDRDWFMVFDNLNEFTEQLNAQGLYWNYFYHQWKTFSTSPFANAIVFTTATPAVTSVTTLPATLTFTAVGQSAQLSNTVVATGFENQAVKYSSSNTTYVTVSNTGIVKCIKMPESDTTVTITIKAVADETVTDTVTVTLDVA